MDSLGNTLLPRETMGFTQSSKELWRGRYTKLVNHSKVESSLFSGLLVRRPSSIRLRLVALFRPWLTISGRVSESGCTRSKLLHITMMPKAIS